MQKHRLKTEAQRLGITQRQLRNWMANRVVPFTQIKRVILFDPIKVDRALEKFERPAVSQLHTN